MNTPDSAPSPVPRRHPRAKWITLDAFGTLFQFDHVLREAAEKVADREHLAVSPEDFYRKWKELSCAQPRDRQPYRKLAEWFELSLAETFAHFGHTGRVKKGVEINLSLIHAVPMYPDAQPFLDKIHTGKFKICIVSNTDNQELQRVLFKHRLQFDGIMTSEMAEAYKPNRKIFDKAMSFIDTQPEEVIHIGDSPYHDVFGAKNAGLKSLWLNRSGSTFPADLSAQPDFTVASLDEAVKILLV